MKVAGNKKVITISLLALALFFLLSFLMPTLQPK